MNTTCSAADHKHTTGPHCQAAGAFVHHFLSWQPAPSEGYTEGFTRDSEWLRKDAERSVIGLLGS